MRHGASDCAHHAARHDSGANQAGVGSDRRKISEVGALEGLHRSEAFLPELFRALMEPGAHLGNDLHRQEAARACGLFRRHAVCDPIKKRTGEHVASASEILGLACEGLNMRLDAVMSNERALWTVGHHDGGDSSLEFCEGLFGGARTSNSASLRFVAEE